MKYLALGDSYTIGESVSELERWPVLLVQALRNRDLNYEDPTIIAKTGWTTDELRAAILEAKIDETYDLVSLSIGVNNQYRGRDADEYRREFGDLLQMALEFAGGDPKKVFVLSIPHWGLTPFAKGSDRDKIVKEIELFNRIKNDETFFRNIDFVDITEISKMAAKKRSYTARDGLHYSGKMHLLWVDEILKVKFKE